MKIPDIPFLESCNTYKLIQEGFSNDIKWAVDGIYLLRMSPTSSVSQLEKQAELTNLVHKIDKHIPYVYEVGVYQGTAYTTLDYIEGENGERILPHLTKQSQYDIGIQAGETLRNMHRIQAPPSNPSWESRWMSRVQKLTLPFEELATGNERLQNILPFIQSQLHLLKGRPSAIQHYDFHPGNIIIHRNRFAGLIDMQKITYGDPIHEFYKMEYFSVPISVYYARGVVDGYHQQKPIPDTFWLYHRLYAAIHIVSAEVWARNIAISQQEKFEVCTLFTLNQFDDFNRLIPKWYEAP